MRRVEAGETWHPSTDHLAGTDEYGTWQNLGTADATFSVRFDSYSRDNYTQFMFATGDEELWLITTATAVDGPYSNEQRAILSSSSSSGSYTAAWYNREDSNEDPWISLSDHADASAAGEVLYGGDSITDHNYPLSAHNGANVFIRSVSPTPAPTVSAWPTPTPTSAPTRTPTSSPSHFWNYHEIYTEADSAVSVFGIDVDGDGDIDVLSASQYDNTIAWYENLGGSGGSWSYHEIYTAGELCVLGVWHRRRRRR